MYQFEGEEGERFFFDYQAMNGSRYGASNTQWRLIDPEGNEVFDQRFSQDAKDVSLSQTGIYTLLIEDDVYNTLYRSETIDYRFRVQPLAPTQELTIGETITSKLSTDSYSLTLDEDSLLYFDALTNSSSFNWSLTNAEGEVIVNQRRFNQSDGRRIADPILDLSAGEYLLKIDGTDVVTDYSFRLSNLNQAESLALGTQIEESFEQEKRTQLYQFEGVEGERFFFDYQQITGSRYGTSYTQWRLIDPDGEEVFDQRFTADGKDVKLSQTGKYTLLVENDIVDYLYNNATSIDYRFRVQPIAETQELGLGETVTNRLDIDSYSFRLEEDSLLYFDALTNSSSFNWSLTNAKGEVVVDQRRFIQSDSIRNGDPVLDLSAGEYLLKIDGNDVVTEYSFKLSNLNQAEF